MNTIRDPFSIRNKPTFTPAFQLLRQQSLLHAKLISNEVQKTAQTVQTSVILPAVDSAKELATDALEHMSSFNIPGNVPAFAAASRRVENQAWASRFGQKDLPLYKDKPYYANSTQNKRRIMRRKRFLLLLVAFGVAAWWFGVFSADGVKFPDSMGLSGEKKLGSKVNWAERRDKVKETFVESWAAYERDAWGSLFSSRLFHPSDIADMQVRTFTIPLRRRASRWDSRALAG